MAQLGYHLSVQRSVTAFAVSVRMFPVAQGAAIGLERLAPLGVVAIGGLIVGTFMTLVFIPVVFIWTVKEEKICTMYCCPLGRSVS